MGVHAYIPASDGAIAALIRAHCVSVASPRVVEVGCGPGRITGMLARTAPHAQVTGVDYDTRFVAYARKTLHGIEFVQSDVMSFVPEGPVDVVVSQGFHHHVPKAQVVAMLKHIRAWLTPGGIYVLGDEFLAHYGSEAERRMRCVAWYSHIIAHALRKNEPLLAREEAKTLLDDLQIAHKSEEDITLVLTRCEEIDQEWRVGSYTMAQELHAQLDARRERHASGDHTLDLSRGDYKIDHAHFIAEAEEAGFRVASVQTFGPQLLCGSMSVFVLRK
ncbi:MAG: class I SAM-dependent methyltransferase [Candidatus Kerfeldbacteria bacterium]|nr:class I SAM-dependent methyltransferase [Candidatus Kerfeldbacteria bacterium]